MQISRRPYRRRESATRTVIEVLIRAARRGDASVLTTLALRSKAHWNYDAEFMFSVTSLLDFTSVDLERECMYLLEDNDVIFGFYRLSVYDERPFLDDLWVDPPYIGTGIGKRLWLHALSIARNLNWDHLLIESDPRAEGFYLRMGANRIGAQISAVTGRTLPLLRIDVPQSNQ